MEKANDLVSNVLAGMIYTPVAAEGDYTLEGLLYCGACGKPRQMLLDVLGTIRKVPVLCECGEKEQDKLEATDKQRKQAERRDTARSTAFGAGAWAKARFELDDRRDERASRMCKRYADNFEEMTKEGYGLMLYGGLGCGKTFLAACIANAVIDQGKRVIMASLPAIIADLGFGDEREETIKNLASVDLLVLDDVGVERNSEYSIEQAYEVINARYKAGKPLIVTTNLSMADIRDENGLGKKRSFDRLIEMCQPVPVKGASRRPDIARQKYANARKLLEGDDT